MAGAAVDVGFQIRAFESFLLRKRCAAVASMDGRIRSCLSTFRTVMSKSRIGMCPCAECATDRFENLLNRTMAMDMGDRSRRGVTTTCRQCEEIQTRAADENDLAAFEEFLLQKRVSAVCSVDRNIRLCLDRFRRTLPGLAMRGCHCDQCATHFFERLMVLMALTTETPPAPQSFRQLYATTRSCGICDTVQRECDFLYNAECVHSHCRRCVLAYQKDQCMECRQNIGTYTYMKMRGERCSIAVWKRGET